MTNDPIKTDPMTNDAIDNATGRTDRIVAAMRCVAMVLYLPVIWLLLLLACTGTVLRDTPRYTCPTPIPLPTATTLPGTALPTPRPQPTPYTIQSPADFFVDDPVHIGSAQATQGVRLRLQNVSARAVAESADGLPQSVYRWQLEVRNLGSDDYTLFPSAQMYLSRIDIGYGQQSGIWPPTRRAAQAIGLTLADEVYTLRQGETRRFQLAAFGPRGQALGFVFSLDPTVSHDSDQLTWVNQRNPYCHGDVADR